MTEIKAERLAEKTKTGHNSLYLRRSLAMAMLGIAMTALSALVAWLLMTYLDVFKRLANLEHELRHQRSLLGGLIERQEQPLE